MYTCCTTCIYIMNATHMYRPNQYKNLTKKSYKEHQKPLESFLTKDDLADIGRIDTTRGIIKGFYSAQDLLQMKEAAPHGTVKTMVFLRHPVERFLSLHSMVKPTYTSFATGKTHRLTAHEFAAGVFGDEEFFANHPLKAGLQDYFRTHMGGWGCTFANNSVAWQLAYRQHCEARAGSGLSDAGVVERARSTLESADFVGFYETLDADFPALRKKIFHSEYVAWRVLRVHAHAVWCNTAPACMCLSTCASWLLRVCICIAVVLLNRGACRISFHALRIARTNFYLFFHFAHPSTHPRALKVHGHGSFSVLHLQDRNPFFQATVARQKILCCTTARGISQVGKMVGVGYGSVQLGSAHLQTKVEAVR